MFSLLLCQADAAERLPAQEVQLEALHVAPGDGKSVHVREQQARHLVVERPLRLLEQLRPLGLLLIRLALSSASS